jgi:hypothetical protein
MNGLTITILFAVSANTVQQTPRDSKIRRDFEEQAQLLVKSRQQPRTYWEARSEALEKGLPLVVGVGCTPPKGNWVTCEVTVPWEWCKEPTIVVGKEDEHLKDFSPNVTASAIQNLFSNRKEVVTIRSNPFRDQFELQAAGAVDDRNKATGPWLPQKEQMRLRSLLPFGVPVSQNLMFYKLPQKYQQLDQMYNTPRNILLPALNEEHPWMVSGGMHFATKGQDWDNATAFDIPENEKIEVWSELTYAGAPNLVPKTRWKFPDGTLAYDVLLNKRGKVFEVRVHEKVNGEWDGGTVYRPKVERNGLFKKRKDWSFRDFSASATYFEVPEIKEEDVEFAPTRAVMNDGGHFIPQNYFGTGVSCNTCHSKVGVRLGYGPARRGDDGRFSWHPFDDSGRIDSRWPIVRR